jgi:predicted GNAT family acetyltransferase
MHDILKDEVDDKMQGRGVGLRLIESIIEAGKT